VRPGGHFAPPFSTVSNVLRANSESVCPLALAAALILSIKPTGRRHVIFALLSIPSLYGECRIPVNNYSAYPLTSLALNRCFARTMRPNFAAFICRSRRMIFHSRFGVGSLRNVGSSAAFS
jgi:hypothetical protein